MKWIRHWCLIVEGYKACNNEELSQPRSICPAARQSLGRLLLVGSGQHISTCIFLWRPMIASMIIFFLCTFSWLSAWELLLACLCYWVDLINLIKIWQWQVECELCAGTKKLVLFNFSSLRLFMFNELRHAVLTCGVGFHVAREILALSFHGDDLFNLHDFTKKFGVVASPSSSIYGLLHHGISRLPLFVWHAKLNALQN